MDSLHILMIAADCVIVGAVWLLTRMMIKWQIPGTGRFDLMMGILSSGMLLQQISDLPRHALPGGMFYLSWLELSGFGASLLMCGLYLGRMALRREMRVLREKQEEDDRAAPA